MFNYSYDYKEGGVTGFTSMPFARAPGMSSLPIIAKVEG